MQGRLCDQVEGKIQAFPWRDWETEFPIAKEINLNLMEWTLDQENLYENPLMNIKGREKISSLCDKYDMKIPSLTGDCFMQVPFWKFTNAVQKKLQSDFLAIATACSEVDIQMIVVPLVDNGRLENLSQEDDLVNFLISNISFFEKLNIKIIFESDFEPTELNRFISRLPIKIFGINYDIGNSAALGFNPLEEFDLYGNRIINVHVKDRLLGGTTVPLTNGNADFNKIFSLLRKISYKGNFILQTARAHDGQHKETLIKYRDLTIDWINQYGL